MAKFKTDDRVTISVNGKKVCGRVVYFLGGKNEYVVDYFWQNQVHPSRVNVAESEIEFIDHQEGQRYPIGEHVYVYSDSNYSMCIGWGPVHKYLGNGMYTVSLSYNVTDDNDKGTSLVDTHEDNITSHTRGIRWPIESFNTKNNWMRIDPAIKEQLDRIEAKLDKLQIDAGTADSPVFNCGRNEGWSDVCAELRSILDPKDTHHWNKDGLLKEVKNIVDSRAAASDVRKEAK
jgi:hypothetical protein